MDEVLRERIKAIFAEHFQRETFKLSMGDVAPGATGVNVLVGFLAQGIAYLAFTEDAYLHALLEVHVKTGKLIDLFKAEGKTDSIHFHYPLILGVIIEDALRAVAKLRKEDDGDQAVRAP